MLSPNIFLHSGHATALTPAPALTDGASSRGRLPAAPALSTRSRRGHSLLRQVGEDAQRSTSVPLHTRVVLVLLHTIGDHLDAALSGALILPWFSALLTARLASTTQTGKHNATQPLHVRAACVPTYCLENQFDATLLVNLALVQGIGSASLHSFCNFALDRDREHGPSTSELPACPCIASRNSSMQPCAQILPLFCR